jgi:carboxypeptidase T
MASKWKKEKAILSYRRWAILFDIDRLNKDAFHINMKALWLLHNIGDAKPLHPPYVNELSGEIPFQLQKLGLAPGPLTVTLTPVSDNIASVDPAKVFNLNAPETIEDAFDYSLDPQIQLGEVIAFELSVDNGTYSFKQPVTTIFDMPNDLLFDPADDLSQWNPNTGWAPTTASYYSAPSSITDSENNIYLPDVINDLVSAAPVSIGPSAAAILSFWAKWDIEEDYDYNQVAVSVNGGDFIPLCGKYTEPGVFFPVENQPVFDGTQTDWVFEEMDLTEYLVPGDSTELSFRFQLGADGFLELDGFYFDDLRLTVISDGVSSSFDFDESTFKVSNRPNPASDYVVFDLEGEIPAFSPLQIEVFNILGQPMERLSANGRTASLKVSDWTPGVYCYRVLANGKIVAMKRFVVG